MASSYTGNASSYDLTVGVMVDMDDVIYTIDPIDAPLLGGIGSEGLAIMGSDSVAEKKFEWMHESLLTAQSVQSGADATTGQTYVTVAAGDVNRFTTFEIIRVAGTTELVQVTSYGTTANTLVVTRAFAGSAATITSGTQLIGMGIAMPEGSDPSPGRTKDRDPYFNYTQIFGPYQVGMSRTEQIVAKYGVSDEFSRQVYNRTNEIVVARERAYIYGRRTESTTTKVRTMGGLNEFITSVTDSSSTQLTVAKISTNLQTCWDNGGIPDLLAANPKSLSDLNDVNNTSIIRDTIDDPRRGRVPVTMVITEFGTLTVLRHRWILKTDAFAWKRDGVRRRVMTPWTMTRLAKTGDHDNVMMLSEEGLEVKGEPHMFKMNALAY